jgi:hypothetical protein
MSPENEKDSSKELPREGTRALEALRKLWGATGRERAFHGADTESFSGRSTMEEIIGKVGYEGLDTFAEDGEATSNTHEAGQRLSAAWKKTMQREGKMVHEGSSLGDLMESQREQTGLSGGNQEVEAEE